MKEGHRGLLVAVEGIDGTGKTTLARRLTERLTEQGIPCLFTFEPTMGAYGSRLRESFVGHRRLHPDEELDLFTRDRLDHVEETILPALSRGEVVVCDRYYFSTMAYQGARGRNPEEIRRINETFAPRPDLVLLLELDPALAVERIRKKRGEVPNNFEEIGYLERVADIFRSLEDAVILRLDGRLPEEVLLERAWEAVLARINRRGPDPRPSEDRS